MTVTNIRSLRDPFVLLDDGTYYVYGTGTVGGDWNNTIWACYKNESGRLDGEWKMTENLVYEIPKHAERNFWAPEVHKYKGAYYMIATYWSALTEHRGCTILKAPSPEGPFVEITNGHVTPKDWDAIDGTLYLDESGQPWLIFVHEWTCMEDKMGRMSAAKLSDDLTCFVSEPVDLFRSDAPSWTDANVTDGCFMYKTKENDLLMIWSNFGKFGYCVGIARSENGKPDGNWLQEDKLLFSKEMTGDYDGGHGMIFKDMNGKMYLSVHSPNAPAEGCDAERVIFAEIEEKNGTLVCDI